MERLGVPTVTIVSNAFEALARAEVRSLGLPDMPVLVVPHPVAARSREVLRAWGDGLVPGVISGLTRGGTP